MFSGNRSLFRVARKLSNMTRKSSSMQSLYDLSKNTFAPSGIPPPSQQALQKLCAVMDTISTDDVGLKKETQEDDQGYGCFGLNIHRGARWAQPITYIDIHECDSFTMCIFCLPTSSVIPLHDHPGMTVLSKVLYGSMHVKAYDWVEPPRVQESGSPGRLAKLVFDEVLTAPCGTSVLYPRSGGNVHCFTAITPCAVLDVLSPPYHEASGRRCTYYHDRPYSTFPAARNGFGMSGSEEEDFAWLAEINTPDDLYMRPGKYTGLAIRV